MRPFSSNPTPPGPTPRRGTVQWLSGFWHRHEQVRYLLIGGWNTLFGYLVFLVLYALLQSRVHYLVIGVVSHAIAVVNAFVGHRWLVFRSREPWVAEFVRFNLAQLAVLGGGLLLLWMLVTFASLSPPVAQAIVTLCAVAVGYLAHRRFSFAIR